MERLVESDAPSRWRKKPVEVDAWRFDGTWDSINDWLTALGYDEDGDGSDGGPACYMEAGELIIQTLEGDMHASPGDYIIRGVQGEFYPCKPDIFEATYERVIPSDRASARRQIKCDTSPFAWCRRDCQTRCALDGHSVIPPGARD